MRHQEIRADFDNKTITLYQAYNKSIALPAVKNNKFEKFSENLIQEFSPNTPRISNE